VGPQNQLKVHCHDCGDAPILGSSRCANHQRAAAPLPFASLGQCGNPKCDNIVVVTTRSSNRVYCSPRCRRTMWRQRSLSKDPLRWRSRNRKASYRRWHRITVEDFERRVTKQGNMCPIGPHSFGDGRGTGKGCHANPVQDHDHETGELRSILCSRHNLVLGMVNDSSEEIEKLLQYLRSWRKLRIIGASA